MKKRLIKNKLHLEIEKHKRAKKVFLILMIILAVLVAILLAFLLKPKTLGNTALIHIDGVLLTKEEPYNSGITSSESIVALLEDIQKNKKIKAIIFEIDSPGGGVLASQEIAQAIQDLKEDIITIAVIRDVGASGAYWVASSCDYIYANKMSITGSIGVIGSYLEYSGLLERFNITYQRLVAGDYKDLGTPYKELTSEERNILQKILDSIYDVFVSEVQKNRGLTKEKAEEIANGRIYLGIDAKNNGLIDDFGDIKSAIQYIEKEKGIKVSLKEYKKKSLVFPFPQISLISYYVGKGLGDSLTEQKITQNLEIST